MGKILGLDLGTNSIGWAVVERKKDFFSFLKEEKPTKGVIVFPEAVNIDAKTGSIKSKAADRTAYRGGRRLKFRRKLRKYETLKVLAKNDMCPLSIEEVEAWRKSNFKKYPLSEEFVSWLRTDDTVNKVPYYYRDKFSRKQYDDWQNSRAVRYELGRAFYHLAQRRGFKSNRLEQSDENVIEDFKESVLETLENVSNSAEMLEWLTEMMHEWDLEGKKKDELDSTQNKIKRILNYLLRVVTNKIKDTDYSNFEDVRNEINRYINKPENLGKVKGGINELSAEIQQSGCQTLGQYFWLLYQKDRNNEQNKIRTRYTGREEHYRHEFEVICETQEIPPDLRTALKKAIFFQRPLRSQKGLVGKCTFEKDKPRCAVSRPEFEEFRMWSFINSIKIKTPNDENLRPLNEEERKKVKHRFYLSRPSFKMQDIADTLFGKKASVKYSREREAKYADYQINFKLNTTVPGNPVTAALKNILGEKYDRTYRVQQHNNGTRIIPYYEVAWHALFTFEDSDKLREFGRNTLELDAAAANKFAKISLQQGYASLSLKAIRKILPWLKKGLIYSHAVFMANISRIIDDIADIDLIEEGIAKVIASQREEQNLVYAVNSLIRRYSTNENTEYSKKAEPIIKKDLEQKFEEIYGLKTWQQKTDRDVFLERAFNRLVQHLKKKGTKDAYIKVKRLDDRVKEFLLGDNPEGVVFCSNAEKLRNLYHPSDLEAFKPELAKDEKGDPVYVNGVELKLLPQPKSEAIKNPVLMRAMHELRKLINHLLREGIIDENTRVHIEMAREVNDNNKRRAWKKWQDRLRDQKENARKEIIALYQKKTSKEIEPTEDDILRYILREEQNKKEIYEDESNCIPISAIIGPDPLYDIEHTIPRSRSWDNSMMNKTLCSKKFNREIKKNKIPAELGEEKHNEILQRIKHWKERYIKLDNEIKNMNPSRIVDPETRNNKMVEKHLKTFERDYWKGKYERFAMEEVPEGFKNSQITDAGLITRFARNYLSCLFRTPAGNSNVRVVNGIAVDQFRKAWGLQKEYEKKSRTNHIHHCIDAVVIACMVKEKYDAFAEAWRKAEEDGKFDVKDELKKYKPWDKFTTDVLALENEVLIVHAHKDNVPKQTKKKLRKRGKIQYLVEYEKDPYGNILRDNRGRKLVKKDKNGKTVYKLDRNGKRIPLYQKGDTVRGSLHLDTFYGIIEINGKQKLVVRKELAKLKSSDIENIVDEKIKRIVLKAKENKKITFNNNGAVVKETIWQNESKQIPLKKVRVFTSMKNTLPCFKKHANPFLSKHEYKQHFHVFNDENYCMAIYEELGEENKIRRDYQLINNFDAGKYYKLSNKNYRKETSIVESNKNGLALKYILKKGQLVLFYEIYLNEIWELDENQKRNRLYKVIAFENDGRIQLRFHQTAMQQSSTNKDEMTIKRYMKENNIVNSIVNITKPAPWLRITRKYWNFAVEGYDFKITPSGKIIRS